MMVEYVRDLVLLGNEDCIMRIICRDCADVFFFSSRRRHTRFDCDWSSDVCSSDLADPRNHYASPLYGDAYGLPPILIHVGSDEILRDDAIRMAERLRAAACEVEIEVWPRMPHAWHLYARILPEGRRAIERIGTFLQQRL